MGIIVSFFPVNYTDTNREKCQEEAIKCLFMRTLPFIPLALGFKEDKPHPFIKKIKIKSLNSVKTSFKTIGARKLPYIKEILNQVSALNCEKFGYINSDVFLSEFAYDILQKQDKDAYIFSRSDIEPITAKDFFNLNFKVVSNGDKHAGADGFFFKKEWWCKNKDSFPDNLIVGATEWDTCYRFIIKHISNNYYEGRNLYHVQHKPSWDTISPEAINNIKIWQSIKKAFGEK
jgi:hypothetical protein